LRSMLSALSHTTIVPTSCADKLEKPKPRIASHGSERHAINRPRTKAPLEAC
jgi:hypothetical protein